MLTLRNGTCAFLKRDDSYLLMKRSIHKKISPGIWSGVGGHMEPDEINDPLATCRREIFEETGITDIADLRLRYVITRLSGTEIRQSYIYFGRTTAEATAVTDEGELFWIPSAELLDRQFSQTFTEMLKHYISNSAENGGVYVGVASCDSGALKMHWTLLEDDPMARINGVIYA